jgi:glycosyltransferase involved in cell wall biosynthesis
VKILHINNSDSTGGAAVAAVRLLNAQQLNGINAKMLVLNHMGKHPEIFPLARTLKNRLLRSLRFMAEIISFIPHEKNARKRFSFSRGRYGFDISQHPLVKEADILHLHWINQGFLSLSDLNKLINLGKPIVWTLHDTWPFTGGCHYPAECVRFESKCGQCPLFKSPGSNDLSAIQHKQKKRLYAGAPITFVGCSNWMKTTAEKSSLVQKDLQNKVYQIFNTIDLSLFKPASNTDDIRDQLNLPKNKKLLLFGAANTTDPRKGTESLMQALNGIDSKHPTLKQQLELVAFGKNISEFADNLPFRLHPLNVVTTPTQMAKLYQACDLFVLPSMQDNLPNTVMESLACGTPVVAYETGGVPEMVTHGHSGFLAPPGNWQKLGWAIVSILDNTASFGRNGRIFAENNFSPDIIASRYNALYKTLYKQ